MASKESKEKEDEQPLQRSLQVGISRSIPLYYDIMVIGKTGAGKSTTADKLLIANPNGESYLGKPNEEPTRNDAKGYIKHTDMYMWHLSDKKEEIEKVSERLKMLVFYRSLEKPHEEVNEARQRGTYGSTEQCELLSNDSTNIRVLDVPGFYGSDACPIDVRNARQGAQATAETDLSIMRKILHIKMAKKFKFHRIVYFLPEKGPLERDNQVLQNEIRIMENYFSRSIFQSMVVVATYPASAYKHFNREADLFPQEDMDKTQLYFQRAMQRVFNCDDVPEPPIIFISMFDSCEVIYDKIRNSTVTKEGVELEFNPATCARCSIKIGKLREDATNDDHKDDNIAMCTDSDSDWASAVPYEDSTCHPMLIPKYSTLQKIVGEIAHLMTFKLFLGKWPSYRSLEEVCINCGERPKSRGCLRVHTSFIHSTGEIRVDHTSTVDESYVIQMEADDDGPESDTAIIVGPGVLANPNVLSYNSVTSSINKDLPTHLRGQGDGDVGEEGGEEEKK
jgi:hypothetical protein